MTDKVKVIKQKDIPPKKRDIKRSSYALLEALLDEPELVERAEKIIEAKKGKDVGLRQ